MIYDDFHVHSSYTKKEKPRMKMIDEKGLQGSIDMHVHVFPDYIPRYGDALSLAQDAASVGMRGLVIKSHLIHTIGSAFIANQLVPETTVFGSVTLNHPAGGLNPRTVIANAKAGAKLIWLPTIDSAYGNRKAKEDHWIKNYNGGGNFNREIEYMTITDEKGELKQEVRDIVDVCKEYKICLCSGHVSPQETLVLGEYVYETGFTQFEVTHPNIWEEGGFTPEIMKKLVAMGATMGVAYGCTMPHNGAVHPSVLVDTVNWWAPRIAS